MKKGYNWLWIDILCIDQENDNDKSIEISKMRQYYIEADICLVVLDDIDECLLGELNTFYIQSEWAEKRYKGQEGNMLLTKHEEDMCIQICNEANKLANSIWFSRIWTLQELLLPKDVLFCTKYGGVFFNRFNLLKMRYIGLFFDKISTTRKEYTGAQSSFSSLRRLWAHNTEKFSFAYTYSLARKRECTKDEDIAYGVMALLGIISVEAKYGIGKDKALKLIAEAAMQQGDISPVFFVGKQMDNSPYLPSSSEITEVYGRSLVTHGKAQCSITGNVLQVVVNCSYEVTRILKLAKNINQSTIDVPACLLNTGKGDVSVYKSLINGLLFQPLGMCNCENSDTIANNLVLLWQMYKTEYIEPSNSLTKSFCSIFPWINDLYGEVLLNNLSPMLTNDLYVANLYKKDDNNSIDCMILLDNNKVLKKDNTMLFEIGGRSSGNSCYLLATSLTGENLYSKIGIAGPLNLKYANKDNTNTRITLI